MTGGLIKMQKYLKINFKDDKKGSERLKNTINKYMADIRPVSQNGSRS
jgi:hypothetical protein